MKRIWMISLVCSPLVIIACASRSYINVAYQLPAPSALLNGKAVFLEVKDQRSQAEIFEPEAAMQFKNFADLYSLSVIDVEKNSYLNGAYNLTGLFKEALSQRLKNLAVDILVEKSEDLPVLEIDLTTFRIRLQGRKWVADIGYDASLTKGNQTIAKERVKANAERVKIVGKKGAETVIGEVFSESINGLDMVRLFQQAKL